MSGGANHATANDVAAEHAGSTARTRIAPARTARAMTAARTDQAIR
jgi:hypothetical protein